MVAGDVCVAFFGGGKGSEYLGKEGTPEGLCFESESTDQVWLSHPWKCEGAKR